MHLPLTDLITRLAGRLLRRRNLILLAMLCLSLFAVAATVSAHGYIVRSIPQDRATLQRPPTRLQYWFSEGLEPRFSEINLRNQNGEVILSGDVSETDSTLLTMRIPPGTLPDGAYIVELRPAFASDGHVVGETRTFFVGQTDQQVTGQGASDTAEPLEIVWRAALYAGLYLLFGIYMLYTYVLTPAWGSLKYPIGLLPPRLMRRLSRLVWLGLAVLVAAQALSLVQQTMVFFNVPLLTALQGGLLNVVRVGSRFGDTWNARMLFIGLVALTHWLSLRYGPRMPRTVRSFWVANTWLLALLIATQAINSHAAGSLVMPALGILVHWLHTLAVAFWIGGLVVLALVMPVALAPYDASQRQAAMRAVLKRYSVLMVGMLLVVIVSGAYNASNWFYDVGDLATRYGTHLGLKVLMVGGLIVLGAYHHFVLNPDDLRRLPMIGRRRADGQTGSSATSSTPQGGRRRLLSRSTLSIEAVLGLVTLFVAAWLSATPVPQPAFLQGDVTSPTQTQSVAGLEVTASLYPGGPGVNTVDVQVSRDGRALNEAFVIVQFVDPQRDRRSDWIVAEPLGSGLYVLASDIIDRDGQWTMPVNVTVESDTSRIVFQWQIDADAAVIRSQPASLLTILAGLGCAIACGVVLLEPWRRLYARLDLSAQSLIVAFGVTMITLVVMAIAWQLIERQQAEIELTLNPLPTVLNDVLPDEASVAQGERLFSQRCVGWGDTTSYDDLLRQLDTLRDDRLYEIAQTGWRSLPPCTATTQTTMTQTERWHIVNFWRWQASLRTTLPADE